VPDPTGGTSLGEAGGIVAGSLALLAAVGKGFAWLLNWGDARAKTRTAKLDAWHEELEARERKIEEKDRQYREHIETELRQVKMENRALRRAFELVSEPLRRIDPDNAGLQQAHDLLSRAFPLDPRMPEDIALLTAQIDQAQLDA